MSRRKKGSRICGRCRRDYALDPEIRFYRGLCPSCRLVKAEKRRAATGARALSKAKVKGVETIDGQEFTVVTLPPKRRGGRRIKKGGRPIAAVPTPASPASINWAKLQRRDK